MARRRQPFTQADYQLINSSVNAFGRLDRPAQLAVILVLLVGGVIASAIYFHTQHPRQLPAVPIDSPHLLLGNPSGATPDPANENNYLMPKPYYALSYNNSAGTPNWVSW